MMNRNRRSLQAGLRILRFPLVARIAYLVGGSAADDGVIGNILHHYRFRADPEGAPLPYLRCALDRAE